MPLEGGPRPYDQEEIGTPTKKADLKAAEARFSPDAPENPVIAKQREQEAREEYRRKRRNSAIVTAAGLAAAAAIALGPREATTTDTKLPDNRQTPEQASTMPEATKLTAEQKAAKALVDAQIAEQETKKAQAALAPQDTSKSVLTQNFEGLDTRTIE